MSDPSGIPIGLVWAIGCALIALFLAIGVYKKDKGK